MEETLSKALSDLLSEVKDRYGPDSELYLFLTALSTIAPAVEGVAKGLDEIDTTRHQLRDATIGEGAEFPPLMDGGVDLRTLTDDNIILHFYGLHGFSSLNLTPKVLSALWMLLEWISQNTQHKLGGRRTST